MSTASRFAAAGKIKHASDFVYYGDAHCQILATIYTAKQKHYKVASANQYIGKSEVENTY